MKDPLNVIAEKFSKHVQVVKINADEEKLKEAVDFFGVEAIPTFCFKTIGVMKQEQLDAALKSLIGKEPDPVKQAKQAPKKPAAKKQAAKKASKK